MRVSGRCLLAALLLAAPIPASAQEELSVRACSPGSAIAEAGFVPIGGAEQWVTLRGADCGNPMILFLHGGPGNPMSPYSRTIFEAWERDFTIVQWDQRGSGRTYGRNPQLAEEELTVSRMVADGIELAARLTAISGQPKIVIVGTSWGSVLGAHMARLRPDLFHAYVGVSQLVGYRGNQQATYARMVSLARAANDAQTLATLEQLGPPPWSNPRNFGIMRRAIRAYEGRSTIAGPDSWWVRSPEYATPARLEEYEAGEDHSYIQFVGLAGDGMFSGIDLRHAGNRFDIPFFLVHGAEDILTVPEVARDYFDSIYAPEKRFILLPRSGHDPNAAAMDAVYELLKERAARW